MQIVVQTQTGRYIFAEAEFVEIDKCALKITTDIEPERIIIEEDKECEK